MKPSLRILLLLGGLLLAGCHESGTWVDDPRNWKRIFRAPKPDDVTVVHSWFWRSPHFTYEYEYYLHVRANADLQKRLLTLNPMQELQGEAAVREATRWSPNKPAWFPPKPVGGYRVLIYSNAPHSEFRLLIDRETGDLLLSDSQL